MVVGLLTAALYGWICVYLKQHQIVTGTAINILALGVCAFFQRVIFGVPVTPLIVEPLQPIADPLFLSDIPVIGPILFDQNILTYLLFAGAHGQLRALQDIPRPIDPFDRREPRSGRRCGHQSRPSSVS
jgi:ABC-type uncharacterized transport system permease subunit